MDLDGTLLRSDKSIGAATVAALRRVAAAGVHVVIATGRMTPTVRPVLARLGLPCALVTYNGACGYEPTSISDGDGDRGGWAQRRIFHRPVPVAASDTLLHWCEAHGVGINVYVDDQVYVSSDPRFRAAADRYAALSGCTYVYVDSYRDLVGRAPTKLLVFCELGDGIDECAAVDALYERLAAVVADGSVHLVHAEFFVEVLDGRVNKGVGLAGLASALGLPLAEMVAFGDGENDVEYLSMAGLGVAMRNGHARAKAAARAVTAHSNDDDGIGRHLDAMLADGSLRLRPRPLASPAPASS